MSPPRRAPSCHQSEHERIDERPRQETGTRYRRVLRHRPHIYQEARRGASGRFAMLDDGMGFSLVPWKPHIEQRLEQAITAVMRSGEVSREVGRNRGQSIG